MLYGGARYYSSRVNRTQNGYGRQFIIIMDRPKTERLTLGRNWKTLRCKISKRICKSCKRSCSKINTSAELNVKTSERQLVYNVVRGLHNKFSQIHEILKIQREKKFDEILEILKEKEKELCGRCNGNNNNQESAYASKNQTKRETLRRSISYAEKWDT